MLSAAYVVVYLPTAVECRFGLPLFVLLAPAAAETLLAVGGWLRARAWGRLAILTTSAVLTLGACAWLSVWMQAQAPAIAQSREIVRNPGQFVPVARFEVPPPGQHWTIEQKQTYTVRATNLGERVWSNTVRGQIISARDVRGAGRGRDGGHPGGAATADRPRRPDRANSSRWT